MNLKEILERNIVYVVAGASVAVGSVVFATTQYFQSERIELLDLTHSQAITRLENDHARDIGQLRSRLASIERGVSDQTYYDIRQLTYGPGLEVEIPSESKYFDDDKFYALPDIKNWQYQKITEYDFTKLITDLDIPKPFADESRLVTLHLWKSTDHYRLELDDQNLNLFPFIFLQKMSYERMQEIMNVGAAYARWEDEEDDFEFDEEDLSAPDEVDELVENLSSLMRDDVTGIFFLFQNLIQVQDAISNASNRRYRLVKVQKVGNILYSQSLTEFQNVRVNGEMTNSIYLRSEIILVSTSKHIYFIKISVPSLEPLPRGDTYARINEWLLNLRLDVN